LRRVLRKGSQQFNILEKREIQPDDKLKAFRDKTSALNFLRGLMRDNLNTVILRNMVKQKLSQTRFSSAGERKVIENLASQLVSGQLRIAVLPVAIPTWAYEAPTVEEEGEPAAVLPPVAEEPHWIEYRSVLLPGALFAFDSAFPSPGIIQFLDAVKSQTEKRPGTGLVVFGHTDEKGSISYNKKLSERRAKAVLSLLTSDLEMFDAIDKAEGWELIYYQAMLRRLGNNPGVIDGKKGPNTERAVLGFQKEYNDEYNDGIFHRHEGAPFRKYANLIVDGIFGPKTKQAVRDAYVAMVPTSMDRGLFIEPEFAGCGEFNMASEETDERQRVVSIAFIEREGLEESLPCKEGDVSACPVDSNTPCRCKFYRQHLLKYQESIDVKPFFDFQWLCEDSNKRLVHLSAITPLPDNTSTVFKIFRWESELPDEMPCSANGGQKTEPGELLGEVPGEIRGGVAFARWVAPEDFDPFDIDDWLVDMEDVFGDREDVSADEMLKHPGVYPPVFMIEAEGKWGFSGPPSQRLCDIRVTEEPEGPGMAVGFDGGLIPWKSQNGKAGPLNENPKDVGIVAIAMEGRKVEVEDTTARNGA
jgi:outer membrane protein OmpA-like peptidoglycan-associated protein